MSLLLALSLPFPLPAYETQIPKKLKNRSPYVLNCLHKYSSDNLKFIFIKTFIMC